jgi:hypothetical protein
MLSLYRELQNPILKSMFTMEHSEVTLILTEKNVFLQKGNSQEGPSHYLPLQFKVKFEAIYQPIPVPPLLPRTRHASEYPLLSNSKVKTASSKSRSTPTTPPSPSFGAWSSKRESTSETSTIYSRLKEKSEKVPLPLSIWLSAFVITRWLLLRPFRRRSNTLVIRVGSL